MLLHWIWLAHRPGVTDRMKLKLLQQFQDPEDIYFADEESYRHVEGMTAEAAEGLKDKNLDSAETILAVCRKEGLHLLTFQDGQLNTVMPLMMIAFLLKRPLCLRMMKTTTF